MKKYLSVILFLFLFLNIGIFSEVNPFILPTTDFAANFCNFPHAWTVSKGKNVKIAVVYDPATTKTDWIKAVSKLAPESEVHQINPPDFLNSSPGAAAYHIILLQEPIEEKDFDRALNAIRFFSEKGAAIILPGYFGAMMETVRYDAWRKFVNDASQKGAIIAGVHGRAYQLGALNFWQDIPVDIFSIHTGFDGDMFFDSRAMFKGKLQSGAYLVAGAAALLKSKDPSLTPEKLKQSLREKDRKVFWAYSWENTGEKKPKRAVRPYITREELDKDFKNASPDRGIELKLVYNGNCLDAALLLGLNPMGSGEWSRSVLKVPQAQKKATGKGVTVAILDHLFDKEDPNLKNRLVSPGCVLEGEPVFSISGHGTWMAHELVKVAPDVKIMPVRICKKDHYGDADLYIKGIEYAVEKGADIISLSHQPIPEEKQKDLDAAIEKASQKGVVFVYIHYAGNRKDVVVPGPIEFASYDEGAEILYMVGTNFIDESSFPYTWGLSQTAPIISGIIAMMKEINPKLKPLEIRDILFKSYNKTADGYPLLDADKAISLCQIKEKQVKEK